MSIATNLMYLHHDGNQAQGLSEIQKELNLDLQKSAEGIEQLNNLIEGMGRRKNRKSYKCKRAMR